MIKSIQTISLIALLICSVSAHGADTISVHKTNFFVYEQNGEPFFPVGANVSHLMNPSIPKAEVHEQLLELSGDGINTLRISPDYGYRIGLKRENVEKNNGELNDEVIKRLDFIVDRASQKNLALILTLFDVQTIVQQWESHPYNESNGGWCSSLVEVFKSSNSRSNFKNRTRQLANRYKDKNILAWEVARGIDVWSGMEKPPTELKYGVFGWFQQTVQNIKNNDPGHLIALSFYPNTLPMQIFTEYANIISLVDTFFLHIRSNNSQLAIKSIQNYIKTARDYRKPIFIAETTWTGQDARFNQYVHNAFWTAAASCSGMFLSPIESMGNERIPGEFRHLCVNLLEFLSYLKLDGKPRPPAPSPITIKPEKSFLIVESMLGQDQIFWVKRNVPSDTKAQLVFNTVVGIYEYQWFYTEKRGLGPTKQFRSPRTIITLQTPEFGHDCIGVLRLIKKAETKKHK